MSEGHGRELYWVWNEKTHLLKLAAELDTFSSNYFLWLDIGAVRRDTHNHQQLVSRHSQPGLQIIFLLAGIRLLEFKTDKVRFPKFVKTL